MQARKGTKAGQERHKGRKKATKAGKERHKDKKAHRQGKVYKGS
jgi:hypothetical protein